MNKDYLSKVLDKIMGETRMDDENKLTHTPFGSFPYFFNLYLHHHQAILTPFSDHCRDVYGLTREEIYYVWDKWKNIVDNNISGRH